PRRPSRKREKSAPRLIRSAPAARTRRRACANCRADSVSAPSIRRASASSSTTTSARASCSAPRSRSTTGANELASARLGAPAPLLLGISDERAVDLHSVTIGKRRLGPDAASEDAERRALLLHARGDKRVANGGAGRPLH